MSLETLEATLLLRANQVLTAMGPRGPLRTGGDVFPQETCQGGNRCTGWKKAGSWLWSETLRDQIPLTHSLAKGPPALPPGASVPICNMEAMPFLTLGVDVSSQQDPGNMLPLLPGTQASG